MSSHAQMQPEGRLLSDDGLAAPAPALPGVAWRIDDAPVPYEAAVAAMEAQVAAIRAGTAPELIWLLQHPPLYTASTSAREADLVDPDRFPVFKAGRGGQYTYHGPGQRIAYVMLDLSRRDRDLRGFVCAVEQWVIDALARFNVTAERRQGRVGVWVDRHRQDPAQPAGREDKIAAIGVRVRHWVTFHGMSLNVDCDLDHYGGIVPCGIAEHGVTSLWDLGLTPTMAEVDEMLRATAGALSPGGASCAA